MSYQAKDVLVLAQQLKVQEITVSLADPQLTVADAGDLVILIREPLKRVLSTTVIDDSAATIAPVTAANTSIVDSTAYTAGGDRSAIRLESIVLAAGDAVTIKYEVQE